MSAEATAVPEKLKRRRWLRFSLRTLLILITIFAVWLGWHMHRRREQQRVADAVRERGGTAQPVLRDLSLLSRVQAPYTWDNDFWLSNLKVPDEALQDFESVPELLGLHLADNQITDQGLSYLNDRTDLLSLDLTNNPAITDAGLAHLRKMTELRQLLLRNNPQITDEGLVHLKNMQQLDLLILFGTSVTAEGVNKLKQKLPKARIGYRPAPVAKPAPTTPSQPLPGMTK
jgi:hypothetical protein